MILRHAPAGGPRAGLSLMEVLVALSIFLISFAVLSQLITLASERAYDVEMRTRAAQLCQSKMNEVSSGLVPLQSQGDTPFDEDGDWQWSLDAEQSSGVTGLWTVTVRVSRTNQEGQQANTELWGMLLDPGQRGSALDTVMVTSSATTGTTSSSSSSSSTDTSGTTTPAATTPSTTPAAGGAGAATKPATGASGASSGSMGGSGAGSGAMGGSGASSGTKPAGSSGSGSGSGGTGSGSSGTGAGSGSGAGNGSGGAKPAGSGSAATSGTKPGG